MEKFPIPYGLWPKNSYLVSFLPQSTPKSNQINNPVLTSSYIKVGPWFQAQAALPRYKQWTKEEAKVLVSKARTDGRERDVHIDVLHFVYSRSFSAKFIL